MTYLRLHITLPAEVGLRVRNAILIDLALVRVTSRRVLELLLQNRVREVRVLLEVLIDFKHACVWMVTKLLTNSRVKARGSTGSRTTQRSSK